MDIVTFHDFATFVIDFEGVRCLL